jgi:AICAR transformylase/IMP cyclohydrolase PurH
MLERAREQVKICLDDDNYQGAQNWLAEMVKQDAAIRRERRVKRMGRVIDIHISTTPTRTRFEWTTESFNLRTGNETQAFGPNHHQAPDFIVESRQRVTR